MTSHNIRTKAVHELKTSDIAKAANNNQGRTYEKLTNLFKGSAMTRDNILDLVGIIFVIEALILSEKMRDKRLADLDYREVENLAMELYLSIDKMRSDYEGYFEMCEAANKIIDEYLSNIKPV